MNMSKIYVDKGIKLPAIQETFSFITLMLQTGFDTAIAYADKSILTINTLDL